jgi:hypothetical protein
VNNTLQQNNQDSTKLVEHLQFVHFWVVVISIAIIAILTMDQRDKVDRAIGQLNEIGRVLDSWNPRWLDQLVDSKVPQSTKASQQPRAMEINLTGFNNSLVAQVETAEGQVENIGLRLVTNRVFVTGDESLENLLREDYANGLPDQITKRNSKSSALYDLYLRKPESLHDFVLIWNGLAKPHRIAAFTSLVDAIRIQKTPVVVDGPESDFSSHFVFKRFTIPSQDSPQKVRTLFLKPSYLEEADRKGFESFPGCADYAFMPFDAQRPLVWVLSCPEIVELDAREALRDSSKLQWRLKQFAEVAPELTEVSKDLETLPFEALNRVLQKERDRTREKLSVFGMQIPAEGLRRWGSLTLVVVQLYLCLHLWVLTNRISRDDPALSVPWIGIYQNVWAAFITLFSATVLPFFSTVVVTTDLLNGKATFTPFNVILILSSLALAVITSWIGLKLWRKLRPETEVFASSFTTLAGDIGKGDVGEEEGSETIYKNSKQG